VICDAKGTYSTLSTVYLRVQLFIGVPALYLHLGTAQKPSFLIAIA
jgi:hypothetical protein